jgi:heme/copper-type cytochrome/quinol oxidase subunit 3
MGVYIKDFLSCCLLFICFIWLYFAMVANAPEETPETPKDTKQIEIIMKG